jgi:signal transduction histidine kinase
VFVEDYLHPDDVKEFERARKRALDGDGEIHVICRIRLRHGVQRWIRIDGKYEFTEGSEPSRLVGVVADITQQKVLEQEATELTERLIKLQEDERQRIAQELHDSTMQQLVAVSLNLMSLRPTEGLSNEERRRWDETEGCLHEAMKEIRTFSYLMHPPALAVAGLNSTVREYVAGYSDRSKLAVKVRLSWKLDRLPVAKQRTLLRIIQEALANVHRHAAASFVRVDGRVVGCTSSLTMTVEVSKIAMRPDWVVVFVACKLGFSAGAASFEFAPRSKAPGSMSRCRRERSRLAGETLSPARPQKARNGAQSEPHARTAREARRAH